MKISIAKAKRKGMFAKNKLMKQFFLLTMGIASIAVLSAQQVSMPAPSPSQTISQEFGMGKIEITYSRPALKERTYFSENSELAPLGEIWRTGANAATKIKITDNVVMGGKKIDSGTYVLYTIPGKKDWVIVINKGVSNWGTDGYKQEDDIVRFNVPSYTLNVPPVENFTLQFSNIKPENCDLQMIWGKTVVVIPISTDIKARIKEQVEKALKSEKPPYYQAANYYFEWEKDNDKALEYVNKAIAARPDGFWMYLLKAKILKAKGNKEQAKEAALKCKELADKAGNVDYVRNADKFIAEL